MIGRAALALLAALTLPQPMQRSAETPSPAAPAPDWQSRGTAEIEALDKVNARARDLTIPVGQSAAFGSLTIQVQACLAHPADQAPDSAAFVIVTDPHPGAPAFHGWMFASDPAASMMEHPIYDVRVLGCH